MAEAEAKSIKASTIHKILPLEVFVKILKKLNYKSIVVAKRTCKEWKKVIEEFKLVELASSKFQITLKRIREILTNLSSRNLVLCLELFHHFSEGSLHNHCWWLEQSKRRNYYWRLRKQATSTIMEKILSYTNGPT